MAFYWNGDNILIVVEASTVWSEDSYWWTDFTTINTDVGCGFFFSIYEEDGIDSLIRFLTFAAANTGIGLYMLDKHGYLPQKSECYDPRGIATSIARRISAIYASWLRMASKLTGRQTNTIQR
jgi:hypothetical protein